MPEQPPQEDIFGNSGQEVPVSQSQFKTHTSNLNDLSWKGDRKSNSYSGTGAPTSTPNKIGDVYVNTTTGGIYIAGGTAGAYSWGYVGSGSLTAFNKDTIAGLYSWYKADDGPGPTTEGTDITSWVDKSDTGNTLTTVGGTSREYYASVQNGLPGVYFSASYIHGVDKGDRGQPYTQFLVLKPTNWGAGTYQNLVCVGVANHSGLAKNTGNTNVLFQASTVLIGGAVSNNTTTLLMGIANGASSSVQINNNSATNGNAGVVVNENRPFIGANKDGANFYTGYIFEWLVYDGALTTANLDIVKAYLNNKWHIY